MLTRDKKIWCWVFVMLISLYALLFPVVFVRAQAPLLPYGGAISDVDYVTCNCGFIIFTIVDTVTYTQYRFVHFYAAQVIEKLADAIGIEFPSFLSLLVPRIYLWGAIWPGAGAVSVLGLYFPYPNAPCLQISSTGCSVVYPGAQGYLYNMGTSLFPSSQ